MRFGSGLNWGRLQATVYLFVEITFENTYCIPWQKSKIDLEMSEKHGTNEALLYESTYFSILINLKWLK
ncbi:hypothetical protein ACX93W_18425 [Paenibacillus sp. CAU 1782]